MTSTAYDLRCTLVIPRALASLFATPAAVKDYLVHVLAWPAGAAEERWRLDVEGYIVDMTVSVPSPPGAGRMP